MSAEDRRDEVRLEQDGGEISPKRGRAACCVRKCRVSFSRRSSALSAITVPKGSTRRTLRGSAVLRDLCVFKGTRLLSGRVVGTLRMRPNGIRLVAANGCAGCFLIPLLWRVGAIADEQSQTALNHAWQILRWTLPETSVSRKSRPA
jgi:hypothetical protein